MFEGRLNTHLLNKRISTLSDKPWYLDSLFEETQKDLTAFSELLQKDYTQAVLETIRSIFPAKFESILNIKDRSDSFRQDLATFVQGRNDLGMGSQMGKVGVVGHSVYFKVYTAKDDYWT